MTAHYNLNMVGDKVNHHLDFLALERDALSVARNDMVNFEMTGSTGQPILSALMRGDHRVV